MGAAASGGSGRVGAPPSARTSRPSRGRASASSSPTRSGGRSGWARWASPSASRGCRRCGIGAASPTSSGGRSRTRSRRWPTRSRRWPISVAGQAAERRPVVLVRGLSLRSVRAGARARSLRTRRGGPLRMKVRRSLRRRRRGAPRSTGSRARCRPDRSPRSSTPATTSSTSGMNVSPDLDTVMYTLAGLAARRARLGPRRGDVRRPRAWSSATAGPDWFALGRSRPGDAPASHRGAPRGRAALGDHRAPVRGRSASSTPSCR